MSTRVIAGVARAVVEISFPSVMLMSVTTLSKGATITAFSRLSSADSRLSSAISRLSFAVSQLALAARPRTLWGEDHPG